MKALLSVPTAARLESAASALLDGHQEEIAALQACTACSAEECQEVLRQHPELDAAAEALLERAAKRRRA